MILFLKFNEAPKLLFLDREYHVEVDPKSRYHIILSPSLYWVRRLKLPLKYAHEAKKMAHSVFEEILPHGEYSYYAIKEGDSFLLFAYSKKELLELLRVKAVSHNNIVDISFAQSAITIQEEPLAINDKEVLTKKDDLILLLPAEWFANKRELTQADMQRPAQRFTLEKFSLLDTKTTAKLSALLLLFGTVMGAEYLYYTTSLEHLTTQKEQLFSSYHLKPTLMQNRAILQKYEKTAALQDAIRYTIAYFLNAKLPKEVTIEHLRYNEKHLRVTFNRLLTPEAIKKLLAPLQAHTQGAKHHKSGNKSIVEVVL